MSAKEINSLRLRFRAETLAGKFVGSFLAWRQKNGLV